MKFKALFLAIIFFIASGYFRLIFFSINVIAFSQATVVLFLFCYIISNLNKLKYTVFQTPIFFILGCVFIGAFNALFFHNQSFVDTFLEQRFMYFYMVFFYLLVTKPDIKILYNTVLILAFIVTSIIVIQVIVYPLEIVNSANFTVERSTVRFRIDGQEFIYMGLFFLIDKIIREGFKIGNFLIILFFIAGLFLTGSRFMLFSVATGVFFMFINSREKARSIIVMFLMVIAAIVFVPPKYYEEITALTADQLNQGDNYIRVKAANHFLFEFSDNISEIFFGNGVVDFNSPYGNKIAQLGNGKGYWLSDVGLIGDYVRFGLFYIVIYVSLLFKAMRKATKTMERYFLITIALLSLLTWPFSYAGGIICFSICLYLIYVKAKMRRELLELPDDATQAQTFNATPTDNQIQKTI